MRAIKSFLIAAILFIALAASATAQELKGPAQLEPGTISVFEIVPAQEAAWTITPTKNAAATYYVDTSTAKLYFATPQSGSYSIVAAVVVDGKPKQLAATLINGDDDNPDPGPGPKPNPKPDTEIRKWIEAQIPVLVKSESIGEEKAAIKAAIDTTVEKIERGEIETAAIARTKLQIALTEKLATAGDNSVKTWLEFLAEYSKSQDTFLKDKINDLDAFKKFLIDSSAAFTASEVKDDNHADPDKAAVDAEQTEPRKSAVEFQDSKKTESPETPKKITYKQICTPRGCYYVQE